MPDSTADDVGASSPPPGKSRFIAFWTSLPGILTGAAALITAVVGLLAALNIARPATVAASSPPPTAVQGQATAVEGQSGGSPVLRRGTVSMSSPDRVDLRSGQIIPGVVDADLYLACGATQCLLEGHLVDVPAASSKPTCVDALRQRTLDTLAVTSLQPGSELCVQTHDSNVAGLRLKQIPGPGAPQLVFDYTLWQ